MRQAYGTPSQEPRSEAPSTDRLDVWWDLAFLVLLASTVAVVLSVPAFPTQDGPVHLYYVDVLRGLLTHSGPYPHYFAIKTFLTPYALEYYVLLALEMVFSPTMSEKLLLCGYILAFGLGFRYLIGSVGDRRNPWTLGVIPFCMNMAVFLGFLNYCYGVTLVFFLSGYWIRHAGRLAARQVAILLAGVILMLVTHPVPAAIFLLFIAFHFAADVLQAVADSSSLITATRARWRQVVVIAMMAVVALTWVELFVDRSPAPPSPSYAATNGWMGTVGTQLQLLPVMPFTSIVYRAGPALLLATVVLSLCMNLRSPGSRGNSSARAMLATAAVCFVMYCVVPITINGSWYFPERFPIFWIAFSIAAVAAFRPPRAWGIAAGVIAVLVTGVVLVQQWLFVSDVTAEFNPALEAAPAKAGSVGLILGRPNNVPAGLAFDPYLWAGAGYFRRSGAFLANTPWMNLKIIMLKPVHPDRWSYANQSEESEKLARLAVEGGPPPALDFIVQNRPFDREMDNVLKVLGFANVTGDDAFLRILRRSP